MPKRVMFARTRGLAVGALVLASMATVSVPTAGAAYAETRSASADPTLSSVYSWGAFTGTGGANVTIGDSPTRVFVPGAVTQVATSNSAAYALTSSGEVFAWGANHLGQFGNGTISSGTLFPQRVDFPGDVRIVKLAPDTSPYSSGLAIDSTGHAWVWGDAGASACQGSATKSTYLTPVEVPLSNVTQVAGAFNHTLYLSNGTLYACGVSKYGDLGDGSTTTSDVPVKVHITGSVEWIGASWHDSAALTSAGYFDWGYNAAGQLGDGSTAVSAVPVKVNLPSSVEMAAIGGSIATNGQTIVLLTNGEVMVWGNDTFDQLGNGGRRTLTPIRFTVPGRPSLIASGGGTFYLLIGGELYAIGQNNFGQAGIGKVSRQVTQLTRIQSGVQTVVTTALDAVSGSA